MKSKYLILLAFFLVHCVTYDDFDTTKASGAFGLARQLEEDERYEEALLQYQDVKNRFPYSQYKVQAELQIAEIQFKKEAFVEAQAAYELFKELHPTHPQIDYVTYKIGESIFMQLPSTIDRDLSVAPAAIKEFDILLRDFPNSKYAQKAGERKTATFRKLAEKEIYIADFYYRTEKWQNALVRYEKYIVEFPGHEKQPHALYRAGLAAEKFGDEAKRTTFFRTLIDKYPATKEAERAKRTL